MPYCFKYFNACVRNADSSKVDWIFFRLYAFTIYFSKFLFLNVNWTHLLSCDSLESCGSSNMIYSSTDEGLHEIWIYNIPRYLVQVHYLIFTVYWMILLYRSFYAVKDGFEMRKFYRNYLMINDVRIRIFENFLTFICLDTVKVHSMVYSCWLSWKTSRESSIVKC